MPAFSCHVSGDSRPISAASPIWKAPLPMNRHGGSVSDSGGDPPLCHRDYFEAAQAFLEHNHSAVLIRGVSEQIGRVVRREALGEIRITLMKHGAFYHPARVTVAGFSHPLSFVLNVAASEAGRRILQGECRALETLSRIGGKAYLPAVYGASETSAASGRPLTVFLGQWFDGFHEFHLSLDPVEKREKIRVWDEARGAFFLDEAQRCVLYRKAAFILTHYYNPLSFEQIFPWHHAAGDFVVRVAPDGLRLRLITARGYAPMFHGPQLGAMAEAQLEQVMAALLIFLLNLSIRMRIDRLDGTGALAWAAGDALPPVWEGFCAGLAGNRDDRRQAAGGGELVAAFRAYLSGISLADGIDLALAAGGGFHPQAAERTLLERHIEAHVTALWGLIGARARPSIL